jgi:L-lactate dehydrogenase
VVFSDRTVSNPTKVVIIGAGFVGSSFAYALMIRGLASEIILIDSNSKRAEGEAMDLNHGLSFVQPAKIRAGDYSDCEGAEIIVISAGLAQTPGQSRLELVNKNVEIFQQIVPKIKEYNNDCILLVATNPVDVMTYVTLKLSGFSSKRVIGSGTILDTSRLRYLLAEYLNIDPRNVHAYILGEHGDSEVPVWSLTNIAGVRIKEYLAIHGQKYDEKYLNNIFEEVKDAAYKIIELKGRTYYAIGLGLTRIIESILRNENSVLTVSTLIKDYYGINDVCLSVPTLVNRNGIRDILCVPFEDNELQKFKNSASILKDTINSLKI